MVSHPPLCRFELHTEEEALFDLEKMYDRKQFVSEQPSWLQPFASQMAQTQVGFCSPCRVAHLGS
jgi:hypothetical protein